MDHRISHLVREQCRKYQVEIFPEVAAGLWSPRQIGIEAPARLGNGVYEIDLIGAFSYMGMRDTRLCNIDMIGRFSSIASGVQTGHAEHPTDLLSTHPLFHGDPIWRSYVPEFADRNERMIHKATAQWNGDAAERFGKITIGNDVWIGEGVFIRRGVKIGDGAIVGARSVVNRDVPPYAIVAGVPAKVIRYRFDPDAIEELLRLQWWLYGFSALEGVDFTDIDAALRDIASNISSGRATLYRAPVLSVGPAEVDVLHYDPESGAFI